MILVALVNRSISQSKKVEAQFEEPYEKALVNYDLFKKLVQEVDTYRARRLVSLNQFNEMRKDSNTIVLDTRSAFRYKRKHIKGAIHLNFSDFTQDTLYKLIPIRRNTRILIYCNNNINDDPIDFVSKSFVPSRMPMVDLKDLVPEQRTLALNIPTYLNLYGYGYRNIYELNELVSIHDARLKLEGTAVR